MTTENKLSLPERVRVAWSALTRGSFPSMESVARWLSGSIDDASRAYKIPARPYRTAPWVRKAISTVAGAAASVPWQVTNLEGEQVEEGPLVDFLDRFNAGYYGLVYQFVGHYLASGEAHLVFDLRRPGEGTLHVLGAYSMKALTSSDGLDLLGWIAKIRGKDGRILTIPLDADSVYSWIDPNLYPGMRFRGSSRLESLAVTLAEDDAAAQHNATLLARGGGAKGYIKTEQPLQDDQADAIATRWDSKHGGPLNTGKTAVLGKGSDWKSIIQSNKDLLILDSRKLSREAILSIFDVPPSVAGLFQGSNRSHDASAREGFWVNTIWPIVSQVGEHFTKAFVPRFTYTRPTGRKLRSVSLVRAVRTNGKTDTIIWGDLGQVPALRNWHWQQAKTLVALTDRGIPLNEAITVMDLPFTADKPWGDTWWVGKGLLPAETVMAHADELATPAPVGLPMALPLPAERTHREADDRKKAVARWNDSWVGLMRETRKQIQAFFFRQRASVLERLDELAEGRQPGEPILGLRHGSTEWLNQRRLNVRTWIDDALPDLVEENGVLIEIVEPLFKDGLHLGGAQIAAEIEGTNPFALGDEFYETYLPTRFEKVKGINGTTVAKLQVQFAEATEAAETLHDIKDRVKAVFKEAGESRAMMIARTETAASVNQGRKEAMVQNGVSGKAWLDAGDAEVRDTHTQAGFAYREGIPIKDPFIVGGYAMDHPSDPAGPPAEVINCRCVMLPVVLGKTNGEALARFQVVRFAPWRHKAREGQLT